MAYCTGIYVEKRNESWAFKLECRGMRESIPLVGNCLSLHLCIFRSVIIVSHC